MKTIRLGNDVSFQWTITRFGNPEDFTNKNVSVALIDKLNNPQIIEYQITDNVISGTFYGKDQITNGTYRLLLVENAGEPYMVTLDYIDAFCLSNKLKNQTSNGSDTTSTINTEVIEITSDINLEIDLSQYAKITYVDGQIADVYTTIDASYYNKQEIDDIIASLPASDTYTKSEIDDIIDNVYSNIDSSYYNTDEMDTLYYDKDYIDSSIYTKEQVDDIIEALPASDTYTKGQIDQKLSDLSGEIPTKVSELDNDKDYIVDASVSEVGKSGEYDDLLNKPTIPSKTSELVNDSSYVVQDDLDPYVLSSSLADVATSGDYDDLTNKPTIPVVPTNVSAFTNDAGYITSNDVSTFLVADDVSTFINDAKYDSSTKQINFYHDSNVVAFIDATAFIKDGMVDNVVIENGYIVITFNTDAGKEAIRIDITDIFNPANYYDKDAIDLLLQGKQDKILDLSQLRTDASNGAIAYGWGDHAQAGYLTENDVSTFITADDVSTFITQDDASVFLTAKDVSTFITEEDASVFLTANDVSTFITADDVSTFITADDVSTFITQEDASIYLTAEDVSTFITEEDASIYLTADDVSTFITTTQAAETFEAKGWRGTQSQYDALTVIEENRLYIILPDPSTNS